MRRYRSLSACASFVALSLVSLSASAQISISTVTFAGPDETELSSVLYLPDGYDLGTDYAAVVMLHGCSGMWSNRNPSAVNGDGSPNLQNNVEKWGLKLAAEGIVALAVDSFTPRTPENVADADWQNQCSGATHAGEVDPYTTRRQDARHAYAYLAGDSKIDSDRIALLGWSQGAQSAMVEAAETYMSSNTTRSGDPNEVWLFATTVVFYPGCGSALGFGGVSSSYWRPHNDFMMNMGTLDSFYTNCTTRMNRAINVYGSTSGSGHEVVYQEYDDAGHSFDGVSQTWPTSKCSDPSPTGNECAMRAADIDSLDFLQQRL